MLSLLFIGKLVKMAKNKKGKEETSHRNKNN
jgi:hypothetical protein